MNAHISDAIRQRIGHLPVFNPDALATLALLEREDSDFEQVASLLSPELTAKFLSMANSSFYGISVNSINHAVRVLGFNAMKQTLITSLIMDHFEKNLNPKRLDIKKHHRQARLCAAVARMLSEILSSRFRSELFTVAMLHDIGKLVIAVYFQDEHDAIVALAASSNTPITLAEERIMGLTHAEIGAMLLESLQIPSQLVHAVANHEYSRPVVAEGDDYELLHILREATRISDLFIDSARQGDPLALLHNCATFIKEERTKNDLRPKISVADPRQAFLEQLAATAILLETQLRGVLTPPAGAKTTSP